MNKTYVAQEHLKFKPPMITIITIISQKKKKNPKFENPQNLSRYTNQTVSQQTP